jgi:hypothetical protein
MVRNGPGDWSTCSIYFMSSRASTGFEIKEMKKKLKYLKKGVVTYIKVQFCNNYVRRDCGNGKTQNGEMKPNVTDCNKCL